MPDVVGGGTTNVTLYDESGERVGTPDAPLRTTVTTAEGGSVATEATLAAVRDRLSDGTQRVKVDSIPEVEVRNDTGNPLAVTATNPFNLEATQTTVVARLTEIRDRQPGAGAASESTLAAVLARQADGSQRVRVDSIPEVEVRNDVGVPLSTQDAYRAQAHYGDTSRLASSGRLSLTLSGNIRALFTNPAALDSGAANPHIVRLHRVDWYTSTNGFGSVLLNVTGNLPTQPRRPKVNPRNLTVSTASATNNPSIIVADTNTLGFAGGVDTGIVLPLVTDFGTSYELPFTLAPGQNLALQANYGKGVDSTITFYWSLA